MINRIVKMTFHENEVPEFLKLFDEVKGKISRFPGCNHLELLRDLHNPNIFFTYSIWDSEEHLEKYRTSNLFRETWRQTRSHFEAKPAAWSVEKLFDSENE